MSETNQRNPRVAFVWLTLFIFFIQLFASKIGEGIAGLFDFTFLDQEDTFLRISVHHLIQMAIALITIYVLHKRKNIQFFLKPRFSKTGIKITLIFTVVMLAYVLVSYLIGYKLGSIPEYPYKLNAPNVLGTLSFQLLLSGTSEEILFRALPIALFSSFKRTTDNTGIIIAAILFSLAHISWTINPFTLSLSGFQLIYAFLLGTIYGVTYVKSKSIIYPIIMHGLSNFFMVGAGYIFFILFG